MQFQEASKIAVDICYQLQPFCDKINIAGSIRRKKPEVKDIEIVLQPKQIILKDMFGDQPKSVATDVFCKNVESLGKVIKGKPDGKHMQIELHAGIKLDLFMASKNNYGNIMLIRTGDWEFSKYFMGTLLRKRGYYSEGGVIHDINDEDVVETPEEIDVFNLVGIEMIPPSLRNLQTLKLATRKK